MEGPAMIGLDSLYGFILLLLIPLLYWQHHLRSGIREVPVSIFPLLKQQRAMEEIPLKRRLRLSGNQRYFLLSIAILCLTLSINGVHLNQTRGRPAYWFFILDNVPSSGGRTDEGTILSQLRTRMISTLNSQEDDDRYTLMVTSPRPRLFGNLDKKQLLHEIGSVKPGTHSTSVIKLRTLAGFVASEKDFEKIVIISPRSGVWRDAPEWPGKELHVPPDDLVLTGNAGFTATEALPVGGGFYDLYFSLSSARIDHEYVDVLLRQKEGPEKKIRVDLAPDGNGDVYISEIGFGSGSMILELDIQDNLAADNILRLHAPDDQDDVAVELLGTHRPVIRAAISSFGGFRLVEAGQRSEKGSVKVYDSTVPEGTINSPTLVISPVSSFEGFKLKRIWTAPLRATFHPVHPAIRNGAMYRSFRPAKIVELKVPGNFQILAEAEGVPLIIAGERNGHRVVVWGFDPQDNGLYLDPAFPVMLRDTISWLGGQTQITIDFPACLSTRIFSTEDNPSDAVDAGSDCSALVRESSLISLPDVSGIATMGSVPDRSIRKDLERFFLLLAMAIMIVLGFDSVMGREKG
jgi:hypothetical protein